MSDQKLWRNAYIQLASPSDPIAECEWVLLHDWGVEFKDAQRGEQFAFPWHNVAFVRKPQDHKQQPTQKREQHHE